jgi:hypothetical protein
MKDLEEASLKRENESRSEDKRVTLCICCAKISLGTLPVRDAASELLSHSCVTFTFFLAFQKLDS